MSIKVDDFEVVGVVVLIFKGALIFATLQLKTKQILLLANMFKMINSPVLFQKNCTRAENNGEHVSWSSATSTEIFCSNKSSVQPVCFPSCGILQANHASSWSLDLWKCGNWLNVKINKQMTTILIISKLTLVQSICFTPYMYRFQYVFSWELKHRFWRNLQNNEEQN